MIKINELWMYVAMGEDEGIPAAAINGILMPLLAGDGERLKLIRPYAEMIAVTSGIDLELRRYVQAEVCDTIKGEKPDAESANSAIN